MWSGDRRSAYRAIIGLEIGSVKERPLERRLTGTGGGSEQRSRYSDESPAPWYTQPPAKPVLYSVEERQIHHRATEPQRAQRRKVQTRTSFFLCALCGLCGSVVNIFLPSCIETADSREGWVYFNRQRPVRPADRYNWRHQRVSLALIKKGVHHARSAAKPPCSMARHADFPGSEVTGPPGRAGPPTLVRKALPWHERKFIRKERVQG